MQLLLVMPCLSPLDVLGVVALSAYRLQVVWVQSPVPVSSQRLDMVDGLGRCDPSGTLARLA